MIETVYKCRDFIVILKPYGMPSQSDPSGDADALTLTSEYLKAEQEDDNLWLVHRLDRVVSGLLVFARNKETAATLSALVSSPSFKKKYIAVAEGRAEDAKLSDFLYKDPLNSKAYVVKSLRKGAKEAHLSYSALEYSESEEKCLTLVDVSLETGRFHQIRVQFSSRKMPLVGDKKYGSRDVNTREPALFAYGLEFDLKNCHYEFTRYPSFDSYPWNLFKWRPI